MENNEFLQSWERRTWVIWGSKLALNYPTLGTEGHSFVDTTLPEPGQESLAFYNIYFDITNNSGVELYEIDEGNRLDELARIDGNTGNLLCFRRRFINTWYPEIETIKESFFADIWVVRNGSLGNLLQPKNLQKAELQLGRLLRKAYADTYPDFGSDKVVFSGIEWHTENLAGCLWQCYDEYNAHDKVAHVLLYPLGNSHYLKLRLYHMNVQEYAVDSTLFGMDEASRAEWMDFDKKVRAREVKGYKASVPINKPVAKSPYEEISNTWIWLILGGIFLALALVITGMTKTQHWFTVWEVPFAKILFVLMIGNLALSYFLAKMSRKLE